MTTLTLGKVKFVNRGTYAIANTYSKGDIVQYASQSYIYKNDTSKSYSPLFLDTSYAGTISSLAANVYTVTITLSSALTSANANLFPLGSQLYVYSAWNEPATTITGITVNSTTSVTVTFDTMTTNSSTQTSVPVYIGTRRLAGMYETPINYLDWDTLSEGQKFIGDWTAGTIYTPGNIVTRNNNSYVCLQAHQNGIYGIDPLFDYVGVWEPFLVGTDAFPHERIVTPINGNPTGIS